MDEETRAALADLKQGIANLTAGIALVARHQTIQGEQLARILLVLTPEEEAKERQGPTTQELLERMIDANDVAVQSLKQQLGALGKAVEEVPGRTVEAMGASYSPPPRKLP